MDCNKCVWARRDGGCTSWDCEYIDRDEAVKAWKEKKTLNDTAMNIVEKLRECNRVTDESHELMGETK